MEGFFDEKTYSVNGMYYYDKNTLGDIVAIRNRNGEIVAKYEYDAWGRVTVMDKNGYANTQADFIGNISLNTKTLQWIGEEEWRFGIPKIQAESNVVPFDFDESLYLGENIEEEWKEKLLEIAKEQGLLVCQRKLDSKFVYKKTEFLLSLLKKDLLSQNFFDICKQNCSKKQEDISENKKMPRKTDKYWGLMYPEKLINTEN